MSLALFFDTETTGLPIAYGSMLGFQPRIIEISGQLIDLKTWKNVATISQLINPQETITERITQLTGITNDQLKAKDVPLFKDIAGQFQQLANRATAIVAHRLTFDLDMLDYEYQRLGKQFKPPLHKVCTIEWTAHLTGKNLKLVDLFKQYGKGEHTAHRASEDVSMMIDLCKRFKPLRKGLQSLC